MYPLMYPPKTYEKKSYRIAAVRMARYWLTRDITPEGMVKFYHDIYTKCVNDADEQRRVLALMAYCMSLTDEGFALRTAKLAGIERVSDRSVGENVALFLENEYEEIPWRASVGEGLDLFDLLHVNHRDEDMMANRVIIPSVAYLAEVDCSRVYAWRSHKGEFNIDVINDFNDTILVDEDMFNDDPPLYFSEHSHFISPVCVANITRRVLESVLEIIGYPPLEVHMHVYFTNPEASLLNADEYSMGAPDIGWCWNGVYVRTRRAFRTPIAEIALPFEHIGGTTDCPADRQDAALHRAVGATAVMLRALGKSEWIEDSFDTKKVRTMLREHGLI